MRRKTKKIVLSLAVATSLLQAEYIRDNSKEVVTDTETNLMWQDNSDAKIAIRRLSGMRKKFLNVDTQMKDFFLKMDSDIEFNEFERWLLWN